MIHSANHHILATWREGLKYVSDKHPYKFRDYSECIFDTQIQSKHWLVHTMSNTLKLIPERVSVLASWYGIALVYFLKNKYKNITIDLYDIDEYTMDIAKFLWKDFSDVNVHCKDVIFDDVEFQGDLLINCSCEHMYDMSEIVNANRGKTFAFQSNDNRNVKWLHINCVDTPEELLEQADIKEVLFKGDLHVHSNRRIMVIGK